MQKILSGEHTQHFEANIDAKANAKGDGQFKPQCVAKITLMLEYKRAEQRKVATEQSEVQIRQQFDRPREFRRNAAKYSIFTNLCHFSRVPVPFL